MHVKQNIKIAFFNGISNPVFFIDKWKITTVNRNSPLLVCVFCEGFPFFKNHICERASLLNVRQ